MSREKLTHDYWGGRTGLVEGVWTEMSQAEDKHGLDQTPYSSKMPDVEKLVILVEEVGEVARAMTYDEGNQDQLRKELIQVCAMAGMWAMSLQSDVS